MKLSIVCKVVLWEPMWVEDLIQSKTHKQKWPEENKQVQILLNEKPDSEYYNVTRHIWNLLYNCENLSETIFSMFP